MNGRYIYIPVRFYNELNLKKFPSTGAYGNVSGMRNLYWGKEAYIIRCGAYAYKVDSITFGKAKNIKETFKFEK